MSNGFTLLARCQPALFACKVSRRDGNSAFFGARFSMMAASPAQNASGEIPVFVVASLAIKSNKTGAIFNPWASIRFMMGFFLTRNGSYAQFFGERQIAPQRAAFRALLAPNPGPREGPWQASIAHNKGFPGSLKRSLKYWQRGRPTRPTRSQSQPASV